MLRYEDVDEGRRRNSTSAWWVRRWNNKGSGSSTLSKRSSERLFPPLSTSNADKAKLSHVVNQIFNVALWSGCEDKGDVRADDGRQHEKAVSNFFNIYSSKNFGARRSVQTSRRCGEKKNFPLGLDHLQFRIIYKTRYER